MNLLRIKRLRNRKRLSKVRAEKMGITGKRPLYRPHPRRKVNKSTFGLSRAQRQERLVKKQKFNE